MSIYNSSPKDDDEKWRTILDRREVLGDCHHCGRKKTYALKTIYANGDTILRCLKCKKENQFEEHNEEYYDNATRWKPLGNDDEDSNQKGSGRYTKGRRD